MNAKWIPVLVLSASLLQAAPLLAAADEPAPAPQPAGVQTVDLAVLLGLRGPTPVSTPAKPSRPSGWIPESCYEELYEYCQWSCYDLSQTGRCDFYANQGCLCIYYQADCPLCY